MQLFANEVAARDKQALKHMAIAARSANAKQQDFEKMMRQLDG